MHVAISKVTFFWKTWGIELKDLAHYFDGLEAPNDEGNHEK